MPSILDVQTIEKNREELFSRTNWFDSTSQLQNRVKGEDLDKYFLLTDSEKKGIAETIRLNVSATPYYLKLSDPFDPQCPIRRMIVPDSSESVLSVEESSDPLHEERLSPVRGLTHMYPNRVLLFSNHSCSVYCRHCMRGRKVSSPKERMEKEDLESAFDYIRTHSEIEDVVISGGDPLNLSNARIDWILGELSSIPHVKICRLGTRNPVTLPFRITKELCSIIESHNNDSLSVFCNTQFNHPKECTPEAKEAILRLLKSGVSVGNQSVLLKGINDSGEIMLELHKKLLEMRVRAYYLYDPELIPGSRGFRTPLQKGVEIVSYMRGKIAGMGIPQFVNDLPGGGGKITLSPNWYLGYFPDTRQHAFRSAVTGKVHFSFEPSGSEYESFYHILNEQEWEKLIADSTLASDVYDFKPTLLTGEWESLDSIELLRKEIIGLGYRCTIFHSQEKILSTILGFVGANEKDKLIVWNLVEGYSSRNREGYIPSICEYLGICHTGSDSYAQHISLDKYRTKEIARKLGIKTPEDQVIRKGKDFSLNLKFPIFAKPNGEGSSIGISEKNIIRNQEEFDSLISELFKTFDTILLEEYIEGSDLTVAILGNDPDYFASNVARVDYPGKVYSSKIKSKAEMPEKLIFDLEEEIMLSVQNASLALAGEIQISGYGRVDFILRGNDVYFLEINLTPGFSPVYSSLPILWQNSGKPYRELVEACLEFAKKEHLESKRFNYGKGE